jgi:hypothetical protein
MKIQTRDPQHLKNKYLPALRRLPELPDDSEEFKAISTDLKEVGFTCPILINPADQLIDDHSRTLLRAAINWQLVEVPVQVCSNEEAPLLRLSRLAHYRHLSKSAIAYLVVPDLDEAFEIARAKMLKQIKDNSGVHSVHSVHDLKTVDDLADELGIGRRLLFMAREVRKAFDDKKNYPRTIVGGKRDGEEAEMTLREWYEPRILRAFVGGEHETRRPMGLGGIMAGVKTDREGNKGSFSSTKNGQLDLFEGKVNILGGWKYWTKLTPQDRSKHFNSFEESLERIPDEQRDELADYLEKLAKKCRRLSRTDLTE